MSYLQNWRDFRDHLNRQSQHIDHLKEMVDWAIENEHERRKAQQEASEMRDFMRAYLERTSGDFQSEPEPLPDKYGKFKYKNGDIVRIDGEQG